MSTNQQLYQQVILEHNKKPRNFRKIEAPTHYAEGYNPLCGDHFHVYLSVDEQGLVADASFEGHGCAISKASASMMTEKLKGKSLPEVQVAFDEFHKMVIGELDPEKQTHQLGKLQIFSGIWKYPSRVKCAALAWHAVNGAINNKETVSTE
jgi:nitrogen fixation NifU-like protein